MVFEVCHLVSFSSYATSNFDDYITLHNLSMLLAYIVTFYHEATRDVVIASYT